MVAVGANSPSCSTFVQIGEVVAIWADEMQGNGPDVVALEEGGEADLAGELLEEEIAAAEIEKRGEAVGDLALDEGGEPVAHVGLVGAGGREDAVEISGEGGVGAIGIGDDDLSALCECPADGPAHPPGLAAGAAAEGGHEERLCRPF